MVCSNVTIFDVMLPLLDVAHDQKCSLMIAPLVTCMMLTSADMLCRGSAPSCKISLNHGTRGADMHRNLAILCTSTSPHIRSMLLAAVTWRFRAQLAPEMSATAQPTGSWLLVTTHPNDLPRELRDVPCPTAAARRADRICVIEQGIDEAKHTVYTFLMPCRKRA